MGYYTVILKDSRSDRSKTFKGIKALSKWHAVEIAMGKTCVNKNWVCDDVYLSKYAKSRQSADKRWTKKRSRHEYREQTRSYWAVAAKYQSRHGLKRLKSNLVLSGRKVLYAAWASWTRFDDGLEEVHRTFGKLLDNLKRIAPDATVEVHHAPEHHA